MRHTRQWLWVLILLECVVACASPATTPRTRRRRPWSRRRASPPAGPTPRSSGPGPATRTGDRTTFFRIGWLVGSHSHLDEIFPGRPVHKAPAPSRLAGSPSRRIALGVPGARADARRLPGAQPGDRPADRARRHHPGRALPVRPHGPRSLHVVVDGQDGDLDAGRHRDRGGPHPLGGRSRGRLRARARRHRVRAHVAPASAADVVGRSLQRAVHRHRRRLAARREHVPAARRGRPERGDAVQPAGDAGRDEVLLRFGRDPGAGSGAAGGHRPSARRVPPERRSGSRSAPRPTRRGSSTIGAGGDVLLPQRGAARLRAPRAAAGPRR